jgi:hypothetical protein
MFSNLFLHNVSTTLDTQSELSLNVTKGKQTFWNVLEYSGNASRAFKRVNECFKMFVEPFRTLINLLSRSRKAHFECPG